MKIKVILMLFLGLSLMSFISASIPNITISYLSPTLAQVNITASSMKLYAYEVNLDYTGTIVDVSSYPYLDPGSPYGATYGFSRTSPIEGLNITSVYGSRLDPTHGFVNNSGILFNITHFGNISLRYALFIDNYDINETYIILNASAQNETPCSGSSCTVPGAGAGGSGEDIGLFDNNHTLFNLTNPDLGKNPRNVNLVYHNKWEQGGIEDIKIQSFDQQGNEYLPEKITVTPEEIKGLNYTSLEKKGSDYIATFKILPDAELGNRTIQIMASDERDLLSTINIEIVGKGQGDATKELQRNIIYGLIGIFLLVILTVIVVIVVVESKKPKQQNLNS